MEKIFVVPDIHGHHCLLEKLLTYWQPEEEQLLFLGDYIDRGSDSLAVLQRVKALTEKGAVALAGNHEQLFLRWLKEPEWTHYLGNNIGGAMTLASFQKPTWQINSNEEMAKNIHNSYTELLHWISQLPLYYQWNQYFFVHGGIDPEKEDPTKTAPRDLLWIRDTFHHTPHKAKEIVIFGHTPTPYLNENGTGEIWISPCSKKIALDGGVFMENGQLNGLVLTKGSKEITVYSIKENDIVITKKEIDN